MLSWSTRSGNQSEIVQSSHPQEYACMLVCLDSVCTLEIITRTLREVVNRERLCGTSAFYFSGFRNLWGCQTPCRSTAYLTWIDNRGFSKAKAQSSKLKSNLFFPSRISLFKKNSRVEIPWRFVLKLSLESPRYLHTRIFFHDEMRLRKGYCTIIVSSWLFAWPTGKCRW